jgi:hypothetical protein
MSGVVGFDLVAFHQFVDGQRVRCLWFLRPDYYPATDAECLRVIAAIERHGDVAAFQRARAFKACLSPTSSGASAV